MGHIDCSDYSNYSKAMQNIESQIQQACIRWVRLEYPRLIVYAIPNGGHRNPVTGAILKAEGVLAGVADIFVAKANKYHHGLYIEMKAPKGQQAPSQRAFERAVSLEGYQYSLCRSFEDFRGVIKTYLEDVEK